MEPILGASKSIYNYMEELANSNDVIVVLYIYVIGKGDNSLDLLTSTLCI